MANPQTAEERRENDVRIALLERDIENMKKYLYGGDGQVGKLAHIEKRFDALNEKIDALNEKLGKVVMVVVALASSAGGLAGFLAKGLMGG